MNKKALQATFRSRLTAWPQEGGDGGGNALEVVSKPRIAFKSKAQRDEKAVYMQ